MRSSVKKCPTIVYRRGAWRGLELSIKSLPLRNKKPDDENHPVFLYPPTTVASSACIREEGDTKKRVRQHPVLCCKGPRGERGGNAQPVRASTIPVIGVECTAAAFPKSVAHPIRPRQHSGAHPLRYS